ncbi:hypothetical protein ZC03_048 [Pseudomonas phage ZC03]|uniref:Uncharacterized protein n=2 Tax=Zicotriavirus TaxID=2843161 RepID=A0A1L2C9A4_9CAUD|nr:hypothetical protein HWA93_gp81 [Pseudomonas phage ZC03]YP_009830608.1 hypothetical protein HWA94_gp80 [Pseudomonas phage ZC08]AMD43425.1 hypothetical protein ZC03_048 [Pseudomonas phage ZC03]AMD43519.1 hypothetical protein ZC08_046 [Pseudomonas phage ZC08]
MSSIRSTVAALNNGIQGFIRSSGSLLNGAATRIAAYLETENEIYEQTREIDIEQRVTSRVAEFYDFETMLNDKYGAAGTERINQLREQFAAKAQARLEKSSK